MEKDKTERHAGAAWLYSKKIAHRGLHGADCPENSMLSFRRAIEQGYNIEVDLHILKDGKIAVFHDFNLKRMCGPTANVKLSELTSNDLEKYRLLETDEKIPLFDELLALTENTESGLLLEFKSISLSGKAEEAAYKMLKEYKGNYAVQSFNPFSVNWFRKRAPEVYRGQLAAYVEGKIIARGMTYALKSLRFRKLNKPDFIAYHVKNLPNKYVDAARQDGCKIICWTVKTPEEFALASEYCDNCIFENI